MKYVLKLEYLGTNYAGWQKQTTNPNTIQEIVERVLSDVFAEPINTICAGRTDKGVHAKEQVIDFSTNNYRDQHAILVGVNCHLPEDISIKSAAVLDDPNFSARFSAKSRHYKYFITNTKVRPALQTNRALWWHRPLDVEKMRAGAEYLLGEQDFAAFRARDCQATTTNRNIYQISINFDRDLICIDIKGNAFLHSMVRKIVGTLLWVGEGRRSPEWVKEVLESRDRSKSGPTVAPGGLYLWEVEY
jgi:tRNA pseudouridine38-40 synthase